MDLAIRVDTRELERFCAHAPQEIPFATSLALNLAAKDAQAALRAFLPGEFTLRGPWVAMGIRVEPSNKRNLTARVGSVDPYMEMQVFGGIKRPHEGHSVAVPQIGPGLPRRTIKAITRPSKWPGELAKNPRVFVGEVRGHRGVWRRMGKAGRGSLRLLYGLAPEVKIPKRWPLEEHVRQAVEDHWPARVMEAVERALRTGA